ncbi:ribosomal-protein-alanine N-acetyltransferase [Candidatus Bathyarchaeota archaeon]|nr:ribosomal-protein-alanine N-acetyltransferase [Candidatus Bathyarchaeota archaeon]
MRIRASRREDLDEIQVIEKTSFPVPWPISNFHYVLNRTPELFLVAEDEEVVGYIVGEVRELIISGISHRSKAGHIMNIAVKREWRERGVGSLLLDEIESRFKDRDAQQVTLEVRESNATARTFYVNRGYEDIGRVRGYYGDEDAIIMRKPL